MMNGTKGFNKGPNGIKRAKRSYFFQNDTEINIQCNVKKQNSS